ncbi:hypothetical protein ACQW02_04415 [Humitalea sp. 24SJ18S-53]|uniref:hypothetical protein n=1 Tax=Humitalea sp. 24SJ18S-53 TaxID=3422307 RepID=UPI003D67F459
MRNQNRPWLGAAAWLIAVLALLVLAAPSPRAVAQAPPPDSDRLIQCSPVPSPDEPRRTGSGFMSMEAAARHIDSSAATLRLEDVKQTARAIPTVIFNVRAPPETVMPTAEWRLAWFEAVAYPAWLEGSRLDAANLIRGTVRPPSPNDVVTTVIAEFPNLDTGWWPSRWNVALLVCVDPGADPEMRRANGREVRGIGLARLYVSSLNLSAAAGLGAAGLLYLVLAFTAWRTHARQYAFVRQDADQRGVQPIPAWRYALAPTVIAQDAFGFCSLSRFQVLLFTFVLVGVYAYVVMRTGQLPELSNSVLTLLGITLTGSTLARVSERDSLDTPNRIWLFGTGVLDSAPRLPQWSDLLAADGEIDVTRVQALAFSIFAATALVFNGTGDLANFAIPEQLNYLIGISQAVYVAGKALPRDAIKRLNEEIKAVRDAEAAALAKPGDPDARLGFDTARNAIGASLFDVFGERFRDARLRMMQPGEREVPDVRAGG